MKTIVLLTISIFPISIYTQSTNIKGILDRSHEILHFDELYVTENYSMNLAPSNIYYPITTWHGNTYFVYIDGDQRPVVGKIDNGNITTVFLDTIESDPYRVKNEGHHKFGMGIDKKGYIHISGNMHNYTYGVDYGKYYPGMYPERYDADEGNHMLYWKSKKPEDISSFVFMGGNDSKVIPGQTFSYVTFLNDRNGELFAQYRSSVGIPQNLNNYGYCIAKYNVENETWRALGDGAYFGENSDVIPPIFWHTPDDKDHYQGFMTDFNFDYNNRLHVSTMMVTNHKNYDEGKYVLYAYSDNEGASFHKTNGNKINLPLNLNNNHIPDIVRHSKLGSITNVIFQKDGTPIVYFVEDGKPRISISEKVANQWSEPIMPPTGWVSPRTMVDGNGIITFVNEGQPPRISRSVDYDEPSFLSNSFTENIGDWMYRMEGHDSRSITEQNKIRAFAHHKDGKDLKIYTVSFTTKSNANLPDGVSSEQLGGTSGSADRFNDIYQLKSSGFGLNKKNIAGQYVFSEVSGNFNAKCRVLQMDYHCDSTYAGIMVSNTKNGSGLFFANLITYNGNITWLNNENISSAVSFKGSTYNEPSEWLRIERVGDTLTAYRSDNDKNWTVLETVIIPFNKNLFLGLISGSGNENTGYAKVDQVSDMLIKSVIDTLESSNVKMYPNPVDNILTVKNPTKQIIKKISFYSELGIELLSYQFENFFLSKESINITELKPGIYFVNIMFNDTKNEIQKILKK